MWNIVLPLLGIGVSAIQAGTQQRMEKQYRADSKRAQQATASWDLATLLEQARQATDASALESFERQKQAIRERGKIAVASGEAMVGGNSILRQLANSFMDESYDKGIINENLSNTLGQNALQGVGVLAGAGMTTRDFIRNESRWNTRTGLQIRR